MSREHESGRPSPHLLGSIPDTDREGSDRPYRRSLLCASRGRRRCTSRTARRRSRALSAAFPTTCILPRSRVGRIGPAHAGFGGVHVRSVAIRACRLSRDFGLMAPPGVGSCLVDPLTGVRAPLSVCVHRFRAAGRPSSATGPCARREGAGIVRDRFEGPGDIMQPEFRPADAIVLAAPESSRRASAIPIPRVRTHVRYI